MGHDLRDKVIVIAGASSGIGAATAVAAAAAGMHVVLGGRRLDRLRQVARRIEELSRGVEVIGCDVRRDQDVENLVSAATTRFQRLDVMFANAGYGLCLPVLETTDAQMREIFETNFYGTLRCLRCAAPVMLKQGSGHMVICSSAASEVSPPRYGAYAATKAAQDAIGSSLRAELHDQGIAVTTVHPIGTKTEFFEQVCAMTPKAGNGARPNTPDAIVQTPEHVARCIIRCLRRPCAEVWPSRMTRLGVGIATAFPDLAAWGLRRHARHMPQVATEPGKELKAEPR